MNKDQIEHLDYQNHLVFSEIESIRAFYEDVAYTCSNFIPNGTSSFFNYDTYIFESLSGTLKSVSILLKIGQITDAYALIRKYFDDLLIEIYFDLVRKEKYDWMTNSVVEDVDNWLKRELRIPRIEKILTNLKNSEVTRDLYPFFGWKTYLKENRATLDSMVHTDSFSNILMNCKDVANVDRYEQLNKVSTLLDQLFTLHLAFLFFLNCHYLMSTDYSDYLEDGIYPPEGMEKMVAPYAQMAFDKYLKPHKALAEFINEHCGLDLDY